MNDIGNFPFVKARWFTELPARGLDGWCIHDMEAPEKGNTAEAVALYFSRIDQPASAHLCFDNDSVVRCVHDKDVAYGAPGVNHDMIQAEHAGYASQTAEDWNDEFSRSMLELSASVCGDYCMEYGWPVRYVTAAMLAAGDVRGITTHLQVTLSRIAQNDHTDPGEQFPIADYVTQVAHHISNNNAPEVVAMRIPNLVGKAQSPNGGLYMVGSDGGVFCFHGAKFCGNLVGKKLVGPVVDIVTWDNNGYWLLGADGGVFAFGSAPQVKQYDPFRQEFLNGVHAARFGFLSADRKTFTFLSDDVHDYNLQIA